VPNKGTIGTILLRLWYDAVLDWGLNPGPPALEAKKAHNIRSQIPKMENYGTLLFMN